MTGRGSFVELTMVGTFCGLVGWVAAMQWQDYFHEARAYRQRYETKYSLNDEERFVRDFFADRRGGVFVDVGANHYRNGSNTYYLETSLGWSGLAIDPQPQFAEGYSQHRPRTRYVQLFVSHRPGEFPFFIPKARSLDGVASGDEGYARAAGGDVERTLVASATLDQILERAGIDSFDFLSMDIERHEPAALAGFSIQRYRPALVCVEAHQPVRQLILDYFARRGYVLVGNYLRADPYNLWFAPLQLATD